MKMRTIQAGRLMLMWLAAAAACDRNPSSPTPPPTPNASPVIASIILSTDRAEVTDEITFAATVTDAETPVAALTYQWTASAGAITSTNGAVATWRPPTTVDKATLFTLTLTVVERYVSNGLPRENRATAASPPVTVLDSRRETSELAIDFLKKFADSSVTPQQCVSTFSDNCQGKQDELNDVEFNREHFVQLDHKLGTPTVTLNAARDFATVSVRCEFLARDKKTGATGWAIGECRLTSVLENLKWWLCESRFHPISTFDGRFIF